jgi:hypothetical protein
MLNRLPKRRVSALPGNCKEPARHFGEVLYLANSAGREDSD